MVLTGSVGRTAVDQQRTWLGQLVGRYSVGDVSVTVIVGRRRPVDAEGEVVDQSIVHLFILHGYIPASRPDGVHGSC